MDWIDLTLLLLLAALGGFWLDSIRTLEIARLAGRRICGNADVQFLDDTVAAISIALARDSAGRRVLRRIYRFEFSDTGNNRLEGRLTVVGGRIESVTMDPYRMLH